MFEIGMKVEYVGLKAKHADFPIPELHRPYTICNVYESLGYTMLELSEFPNPENDRWYAGFNSAGFRPIVEPKQEISFTTGADPDSEQWDGRRKVRETAHVASREMVR